MIITRKYYYVPIKLDYFNSDLNWKFDSKNKRLMNAKTNLQAQKEAATLYELEKEKNLGFGREVYSVFSVNEKQQKVLKTQYPKKPKFLGLVEPEMYVLGSRKMWVKTPVNAVYSGA